MISRHSANIRQNAFFHDLETACVYFLKKIL